MEKEKLQYDASITGWLKQKGKDIQDWFTSPKTRKAIINAGLILCHDELDGPNVQQMVQDAIQEKDPEVLEKQNLILATPAMASALMVPGAKWAAVAGSAMELPRAINNGYQAYRDHDYYELYDQMLNGLFSSVGLIPAVSKAGKAISNTIKKPKSMIQNGQVVSDFGWFDPFEVKDDYAKTAQWGLDYEKYLREAKEYMSSNEVMEAAKRSNRVAKMLYEKDPVKYPFKNTNMQVGPANTKVTIELDPTIPTRGKYIGQNNGEGIIKINPEYHPKIQENATFHEGLHAEGMGTAAGQSANAINKIDDTAKFNMWKAELMMEDPDNIENLNTLRRQMYLTTIYNNGNEFAVNFAAVGKAMGLNPQMKYPGPVALEKYVDEFRKIDPKKAEIFDTLKKNKDGHFLYPGYVWRMLTGQYRNGGKLINSKRILRLKKYLQKLNEWTPQ